MANKSFHQLVTINRLNVNRLSLAEALKKKYKVCKMSKGNKNRHGNPLKNKMYQCRIYVPLCFCGKKVKLRIVK